MGVLDPLTDRLDGALEGCKESSGRGK